MEAEGALTFRVPAGAYAMHVGRYGSELAERLCAVAAIGLTATIATAAASTLGGPLELPSEALPRHVQAPLNGADGCLEMEAHLPQRLPADVEGLQRSAVERLEPVKSPKQRAALLGADHLLQGRGPGRMSLVE